MDRCSSGNFDHSRLPPPSLPPSPSHPPSLPPSLPPHLEQIKVRQAFTALVAHFITHLDYARRCPFFGVLEVVGAGGRAFLGRNGRVGGREGEGGSKHLFHSLERICPAFPFLPCASSFLSFPSSLSTHRLHCTEGKASILRADRVSGACYFLWRGRDKDLSFRRVHKLNLKFLDVFFGA